MKFCENKNKHNFITTSYSLWILFIFLYDGDVNKMYNKIGRSMGECKICENPQNCATCEFRWLIAIVYDDDDDDWINLATTENPCQTVIVCDYRFFKINWKCKQKL